MLLWLRNDFIYKTYRSDADFRFFPKQKEYSQREEEYFENVTEKIYFKRCDLLIEKGFECGLHCILLLLVLSILDRNEGRFLYKAEWIIRDQEASQKISKDMTNGE